MELQRQPNQLLRQQRLMRGWSQKRLADQLYEMSEGDGGAGINADMVSKWERGEKQPRPYYQEKLCMLFGTTADQLGFLAIRATSTASEIPELGAGDYVMTNHFDPKRRRLLQLLGATGPALLLPNSFLNSDSWERLTHATNKPHDIDQATLNNYEKLIQTCWQLSNKNSLDSVEQILQISLPAISALAEHPSVHQQQAASLASQGHQLAYVVTSHREDFSSSLQHTNSAKLFGERAKDPNLLVSSLVRQGVTFLHRRNPFKALESYQEASQYVNDISPLLRTRLYAALAEVQGKLSMEQDARRSVGQANESFSASSEDDPTSVYIHFSESSLYLHEGLALLDLHKPAEAMKAFMKVDGLRPRLIVSERSRVDFLNQQAMAAGQLRDLDQFKVYLENAVISARALGSELRLSEAWDVFKHTQSIWGNDPQINILAQIFQS